MSASNEFHFIVMIYYLNTTRELMLQNIFKFQCSYCNIAPKRLFVFLVTTILEPNLD